LATTDSTSLTLSIPRRRKSNRDFAELVVGFLGIMTILWLPTHEQLIFGPIALLLPLMFVLWRRPTLNQLGLGLRGLIPSLWILPAAVALTVFSVLAAERIGTYHSLYNAGFAHVWGYVLWTMYQQFLLQDYFMPRLGRLLSSDGALAAAAILFAVAHLPNVTLAFATLIWGAVSCLLFRRYHNLYMLGLAQGILGLCFAVCVPDALIHHMRVGLGYWHYGIGR
jgi:CAAX prenyl protease-like protein